jgi:CheY-like chemotaxis protein/anti-sigma regulatory factor (Ser/Thr protein kinase)
LEGILTNLLKNAIKFSEQGEISFSCSLIKEQGADFLEFFVKDSGKGIPADRIDAIFNRFEQADIEDKNAHQGSGLGLAITKSYVEMLGGNIRVISKEGFGSIFTFTIPYIKPRAAESSVEQNMEECLGVTLTSLSVIVAEDDQASRMYFEAVFANMFKNLTFTSSGIETIAKFRENPNTDLILMDVKMPDMNGYDATREIRKLDPNVIIIAQTAFGLSGDREKAIEVGCNDYISKPIKKEKLLKKIYNHFGK